MSWWYPGRYAAGLKRSVRIHRSTKPIENTVMHKRIPLAMNGGKKSSSHSRARITKVSSEAGQDCACAAQIASHFVTSTSPVQSHTGHSGQLGVGDLFLGESRRFFRSSAKARSTAFCVSTFCCCRISFRILASTSFKSTSSTTTSLQTVTAAFPAASLTLYGTVQRSGDCLTGSPMVTSFERSTRPLYVRSYACTHSLACGIGLSCVAQSSAPDVDRTRF